jgi:hypothetical protein
MQISLFLDRFHVQLAARAQLHPLDDFDSWVEITHAAAVTAAGAIHALAPLCGVASAVPVERSTVALEVLRATCTRSDLPSRAVVASCEAAFADMCSMLRASCDFGSL